MPANLGPEQLKEVDQFMQLLSEYADKCDIGNPSDNPSDGPDARHPDSITVADFVAGFNDPGASALINSITRSLLTTIDGDVYRADKVIVSVPTPFYPLIQFETSLPPAKKALDESAKSGYYTKTVLVYAEPWWHSAGLSGVYSSANGPVVFTHDTCVPQDGQYSINCFHAGDPGWKWSRLPAEERKKIVLQDIRTTFGTIVDTIPKPINAIDKDWTTKDPWAQGGPGPVWRPGFFAGESGKTIAEPFGNIHFVGTETASVWSGYMDGAVRSGIRGGRSGSCGATQNLDIVYFRT
ncbi:related to amine oxidase [Fusarium fujikuroi]|nr:related to amine oxidase [Fusarium fujikuroi]